MTVRMPARLTRASTSRRVRIIAAAYMFCAPTLFCAPTFAHAQATEDELHVLRLEATPIGALPPIALPMPASRNQHYWGGRLQVGQRTGRGGSDLGAIAAGVDLQYRGGSVYGITAGYQRRDCELLGADCGGHPLFGARARINLITGGPSIGALFGDYSATSTLVTEIGFGYAPDVMPGSDACTIDVGVPVSIAMLQRIRLVSYVTPGVVWDMDCSPGDRAARKSYLTGLGFGLQQLGHRGFDVYLGLQKIFRSNACLLYTSPSPRD